MYLVLEYVRNLRDLNCERSCTASSSTVLHVLQDGVLVLRVDLVLSVVGYWSTT